MYRILITGGIGFIGSNLAHYFLKNGAYVVIYDNFSRLGAEYSLNWLKKERRGRLKIIRADVRDLDSLMRNAKDAEAIIHTAAQVAVTTSLKDPVQDFEVNARGTLNVLEAARRSKTDPIVVFTSTNKVYGDLGNVMVEENESRYDFKNLISGIDESFPLDPISPYGCSKCAGDTYVLDYHQVYGLKTIVFRMSCIFGTQQFGTEDQGWVAHFIISSVLDRKITIYGDGKQVRDILYVDDLIRCFEMAIKQIKKTKGRAYNIGGGPRNTISLLELTKNLESLLKKQISYSFDQWRSGDQRVYYSNITKAEQDFGWKPKISKEDGIKKLLNWVLDNKYLFR